ncbi:MAG TPA: M23 family metallopeptidase [Dehalococcoidia bacterium]
MTVGVVAVAGTVSGASLVSEQGVLRVPEVAMPGTVSGMLAVDEAYVKAPTLLRTEESRAAVLNATPTPTPSPTPTPPPPPFIDYEIRSGDTVSTLAQRFGISQDTLVDNNPETISNPNELIVGKKLRIPRVDGYIHWISLGETISALAARYGVDEQKIIEINNITNPREIQPGAPVLVPGARPIAYVAVQPSPTAAAPAPSGGGSGGGAAQPAPAPASTSLPPFSGLIWPVQGPISSYFGPGHPLGIDIDQYHSPGAPVAAAAPGVVTFAGGDPCCSYGYWVEIQHAGGYTTRYAHLSRWPAVSIGQQVAAGDLLGYSGSTGYSTGYHLHFEVRLNGTPLNPCNWLGC